MRLFLLVLFVHLVHAGMCQQFARYSSILDRKDLDILEADSGVSYDKMGIIMYNGKYDPDLVIEYGFLCYDRYKATGDSSYLLKMDEQMQFVFGGKSDHMVFGTKLGGSAVRLTNDTLDIKGPRYSARMQGLALSLIVRYNTIGNEARLKKYAASYFLVLTSHEDDGGCLSRRNDGHIWLEEFPNSKLGRHSLKGMLTAVIGLIEYCQYDDSDIRAKRIADEALLSLKMNLPSYNDGKKVYADMRRSKSTSVNDQREMIFLMKHLYELTGDPVFLREMGLMAVLMGHRSSETTKDWDLFYSNTIVIEGKLKGTEITQTETATHLLPQEKQLVDDGKVMSFPWYTFTMGSRVVNKVPSVFELAAPTERTDFHVLYRYHWDPALFESEPWSALNGSSGSHHNFQMAPGYYQFLTLSRGPKENFELITNDLQPVKK